VVCHDEVDIDRDQKKPEDHGTERDTGMAYWILS
jgi:hypothetical protein